MNVWVAGIDKPHRCPSCWRCAWLTVRGASPRGWRVRRWFPRKCRYCGAITLTTNRWRIYGSKLGGKS